MSKAQKQGTKKKIRKTQQKKHCQVGLKHRSGEFVWSQLSQVESSVLEEGSNFAITPNFITVEVIIANVASLIGQLVVGAAEVVCWETSRTLQRQHLLRETFQQEKNNHSETSTTMSTSSSLQLIKEILS